MNGRKCSGFGNSSSSSIHRSSVYWFFQLGLQAAGWATAKIAQTWIRELLFEDLKAITCAYLIIMDT